MNNSGTYNVSYSTLPTFASSDIGYIVPGSQTIMQQSLNIPINQTYALGQFTNVEPGIYLFNLTGNFYCTYNASVSFQNVATFLTTQAPPSPPSNSQPSTSIVETISYLGPISNSGGIYVYLNGINMSSIVQVTSPTTYYITSICSIASSCEFQNYTFSLCKIA
jgi:hypothetical protein